MPKRSLFLSFGWFNLRRENQPGSFPKEFLVGFWENFKKINQKLFGVWLFSPKSKNRKITYPQLNIFKRPFLDPGSTPGISTASNAVSKETKFEASRI